MTVLAGSEATHHEALGLPRIFSPADAVHVLRSLGLTGMTECALRTRAYRKQVPFHLNGRRITFTLGDLQEIAEGKACRPQSRTPPVKPGTIPQSAPHRRPPIRGSEVRSGTWRARRRSDLRSAAHSSADTMNGQISGV